MGLKDENLFGLIDNISDFLNSILFSGFKVDVKCYENYCELLDLKKKLKEYIEIKQFKKGEQLLFSEIKKIEDKKRRFAYDYLRVGYWFFLKLNVLTEEDLKNGGYERLDVMLGMEKIEKIASGENISL